MNYRVRSRRHWSTMMHGEPCVGATNTGNSDIPRQSAQSDSPRMINTSRHCPNVQLHDLRPCLSRRYFPLLYPSESIPANSSLYAGTNPTRRGLSDVIPAILYITIQLPGFAHVPYYAPIPCHIRLIHTFFRTRQRLHCSQTCNCELT